MSYVRATHSQRYGRAHQLARARWARIVAAGGVDCTRCQQPITAGQEWHLDHADDGTYRGPSHARCNIVASNQKAKDPAPRPTTKW